MSNFWGKFVSTEGNEKDKTDEEGESSCDDEESSELVKVSLSVVSIIGLEDNPMAIAIVEILVASSSNLMRDEIPAKWSPVRSMVRTSNMAKAVFCPEVMAITVFNIL